MALQIGDLVDGRYRVRGLLGQGGAGRVFRVEDQARGGAVVALKVLERTDEKWVAAFRREFETLAAMSHPNVVKVMDFGPGPEPGTAYFTAELVRGDDIYRVTETLGIGERLALLAELVRALSFIHGRGVLHRDLKPSNVLVDRRASPGSRVKLVDFGLARGAGRKGKVTLFAGTPPYMAPELLDGQPPTVATDLYALGVTAYRILKREMPYQARTAAALQIARAQALPQPLPEDVDADVAALIHELMDPDPAKRAPTAAAVSSRLERSSVFASEPPPLVMGEAPLLGRVVPLSVLKLAYENAVQRGQGGTLLLRAPTGMGKTRLLAALEDTVQLLGGRVASAGCAGDDAPPVSQQLARGVLAFVGRTASPESLRVLTDSSLGLTPRDRAGVEALGAALDAGTEPRLLVVEDVHRADLAGLQVLGALASRPQGPRLLLLSARDDVDWPPGLAALASVPGVQQVVLSPLSGNDSRALAASLLGRSALPMELVEDVAKAQGVPRGVEDVVRKLLPQGVLRPGDAGLTLVNLPTDDGTGELTTSNLHDPTTE